MPQFDAIKFAEDEGFHVIGVEPFGDDRIGHTTFDVLIDAEVDVVEKFGLADENHIVISWEVLKHEPQTAQGDNIHPVGFVDDDDKIFSLPFKGMGFFDQFLFTFKVAR